MVFNRQFGHPLCENVTLKHLPSVKAFFPGVTQKRLQPWHSSDDCCDSAVGQNAGFFKTLGLRPRYFQAETYQHSCESKIIDAEDVRDGACGASWQLHLNKNLQNAKIQLKTHVLASWHFARTAHQRILQHLQKLQCAKIKHVAWECIRILPSWLFTMALWLLGELW